VSALQSAHLGYGEVERGVGANMENIWGSPLSTPCQWSH